MKNQLRQLIQMTGLYCKHLKAITVHLTTQQLGDRPTQIEIANITLIDISPRLTMHSSYGFLKENQENPAAHEKRVEFQPARFERDTPPKKVSL